MATTKKYLDITGLQRYDTKSKALMDEKIAEAAYDDTDIKARISANENVISVLDADETTDGSVKKQVADAVAKIVADAPESYDTLKEISDWISTHASDAATMNSNITTNTSDIAALKTLIGTLPDGLDTEVNTIVKYIDSKISGVDFSSEIATAKSEAISTAAADATTKADNALSSAKTYADGLASNYATAAQGTKADTALQASDIGSAAYKDAGSASGSVPVNGAALGTTANVPVVTNTSGLLVPHASGALKSAAFVETSDFDAAGTAQAKVTALENGQVATNKTNIESLQTKVSSLEDTTYVAITNDEIDALFA